MFSTGKKYIIIGNDAAAVFRICGKNVTRLAYLLWDEEDFDKQFIESVKSGNENEKVTLLFDMIEQQYKKEVLPRINPLDRGKVIRRKVSVAFPSNPVREALDLKRSPKESGINGNLYLLASIPPCRELDKITDLLKDTAATPDGLYLLPLEGTALAKKLAESCFRGMRNPKEKNDNVWTVLITYNRTGGLRQVVVHKNELALTRLTPLGNGLIQNPTLSDEIIKEFKATLTYLSRFGYRDGDGVDVIAICSPEDANILHSAGLPVTHLATPTPAEAVRILGRRLTYRHGEESGNSSGIVHATWFDSTGKRILPMNFSPLNKIKTLRTAAGFLTTLLIFSFLGGIFYAGSMINREIIARNEFSVKETSRISLRKEHEEKSKMMNVLKYPPEKASIYLQVAQTSGVRKIDWAPYINGVFDAMGQAARVKIIEIQPDNGVEYVPQGEEVSFVPNVKVTVTLEFPEALMPDDAKAQTEFLISYLKRKFPEYTVKAPEKAGEDISLQSAVQGASGLENAEMEDLKTKTTVIEMKGAAL